MKTAVFSVVYPGTEKFLPEFLKSLSKQTDSDFVLYLINDNFGDLKYYLKQLSFPVKINNAKGLPAFLRKTGIEWLKGEGIESVIFADADDYFSENRIETAKKLLVKHDIAFNELVLFGEHFNSPVPMLKTFYKEGEEITDKDLVNYNCLGMSNTAVRTDNIPEIMMEIPDSHIAFDWALFALALHSGARAVFTEMAKTWYRQHNNNIASPLLISDAQILRGVHVKLEHYSLLSKWYVDYKNLTQEFTALFEKLNTDSTVKKKYCCAVREQALYLQRWWEPMKSLDALK